MIKDIKLRVLASVLLIITVVLVIPTISRADNNTSTVFHPTDEYGVPMGHYQADVKGNPVNIVSYQSPDIIGGTIDTLAKAALELVLWLLQLIAGVVLYLGSQLITFLFQLNTSLTQLPIVLSGWAVSRDIANLGFVLALIIIAFMTILRFNQYGAQKMLPKLIAAAILVNFSLTIGGAILDFTNVVTKFFVDRSVGGTYAQAKDIGSTVAGVLNPQKFLEVNTSSIQNGLNQVGEQANNADDNALLSLLSTFFIAAFTFLIGLVLLANGLMLLTRFVYLTLLLAVAPFPWLFGIIPIPNFQSLGRQWWQKFMQWAFVAPFLSFFLYLTLRTAETVKTLTQNVLAMNPNAQVNFTYVKGFLAQTTNALVLCGFLVGGLLAANSMGIWGGKALLGVAKKTGEKAKGWAKSATLAGPRALGRGLATWGAGSPKEGKGGRSFWERAAESKAGRWPVLGAALSGIAGVSVNAKEQAKKVTEEGFEDEKKKSRKELANKLLRQKVALTRGDLPAALALAEKGGLDSEEMRASGKRDQVVKLIKRYGLQKQFARYDPIAAADADATLPKEGETPQEARERKLKQYTAMVEDVTKLDAGTIEKSIKYMTQSQKAQVGFKGTDEQRNAGFEGEQEPFKGDGTREKDKNGQKIGMNESEVAAVFQELQKTEVQLDKNLSALKEAKDTNQPRQVVEALTNTRVQLKQAIKQMNETLINSGNPSEEVKDKRRSSLQDLDQMKKQPAWQAFFQKKYKTEAIENEEEKKREDTTQSGIDQGFML